MPVVINPETPYGQEMAKWNKPYHFEPFPKMLYKAQRRPDGVVACVETSDAPFGGNPGAAEQFTRSCQTTVNDETELTRALETGYRESPAEAMEYFEEKARYLSTAAAHRHHEDRGMSDKAKAEASAADDETPEHVAEVPRKRGRPRKRKA